jgi:hypothetical protein
MPVSFLGESVCAATENLVRVGQAVSPANRFLFIVARIATTLGKGPQ